MTAQCTSIPLLAQHPALARALSYVRLGELPTPVGRLSGLERETGHDSGLWVKRDDLSGRQYGGNKLRKLEFLLGEAQAAGAREVLTFGAAGSNHALATAVYAPVLGMRSISMLVEQVNAPNVARNIEASWRAGAELHHYPDESRMRAAVRYQLMRHERLTGCKPHVIPGGGSSALGSLGFVNAALELAAQVEAGLLPAPDVIYVALGTVGTAVGLALGLQLAGLDTRIVAVRVVRADIASPARIERLYRETLRLVQPHRPDLEARSVPALMEMRHEFFGAGYARLTAQAREAIRRVAASDGLRLEQTYTGKAMAALLCDLAAGRLQGTQTLFWNTYNSRPLPIEGQAFEYRRLPAALHRYFEESCDAPED